MDRGGSESPAPSGRIATTQASVAVFDIGGTSFRNALLQKGLEATYAWLRDAEDIRGVLKKTA